VAIFVICLTRPSSLVSPVRHVRRRLIMSSKPTRRRATIISKANKETGVNAPVLRKIMLAAAEAANMPIVGSVKGIRSAQRGYIAILDCVCTVVAFMFLLHSRHQVYGKLNSHLAGNFRSLLFVTGFEDTPQRKYLSTLARGCFYKAEEIYRRSSYLMVNSYILYSDNYPGLTHNSYTTYPVKRHFLF
jgi:hypothetical protein